MTTPFVVSLTPAGTDILLALGARGLLRGVDPESAADPRLAGCPIADGAGLPPGSLILTGPGGGPTGEGCTVLRLDPRGVEEAIDDCLRVSQAVGLQDAGTRLAVSVRNRLFAAAEFVNPYADGPVVAFVTRTRPPTGAGSWIVQLIERAGGRYPWNPTVARPGTGEATGPQHGERLAGPAAELRGVEFVEHEPDALVICPEGLGLEESEAAAREFLGQRRFASLVTRTSGRVAVVEGRGTFGRAGPRLADCFEWLVGWLHDRPDLMPASVRWRALGR